MKKLIALTAIIAILAGCNSGDRGELVGTKGKKWHPEKPQGMVIIPGGSFSMGKAYDDFVVVNAVQIKICRVLTYVFNKSTV